MPKKTTVPTSRTAPARRAKKLIERMLREMEGALDNPSITDDPEWLAIFGDKKNMIGHVQTLVQTLGALPENKRKRKNISAANDSIPRFSPEDTALLVAWLKEQGKKCD